MAFVVLRPANAAAQDKLVVSVSGSWRDMVANIIARNSAETWRCSRSSPAARLI
jgi:hypothetical protein